MGWERPNWFADLNAGETAEDEYSFGRQNWFAAVAREHKAVRETAALFDQTSFAKYSLIGPDAETALNWIAANNVARPVGSLIYTQMLNGRGGIECDLTCARVADDEYYIVTGTGFITHNFDWISRNIPAGCDVELKDVSASYSVLALMGPNARKILQSVSPSDVSNEAMKFGTTKDIDIAGVKVRALRITYVGELGWELHIPVDKAAQVYDALMQAGEKLGILNAGYRAIESCRLEKGYRAWGADIGPDHTPLEAGLDWAVKLKSNMDFKGRSALEKQRPAKLKKKLASFTADDPKIVLLGRETIYRNGERVGWLSSGGYGHTIAKSIGMGYIRYHDGVDDNFILSGEYELDVAQRRVSCKVHLKPLYDPTSSRVKS